MQLHGKQIQRFPGREVIYGILNELYEQYEQMCRLTEKKPSAWPAPETESTNVETDGRNVWNADVCLCFVL